MAEKVSNIVLIVADALRPDRVGTYSEGNLTLVNSPRLVLFTTSSVS